MSLDMYDCTRWFVDVSVYVRLYMFAYVRMHVCCLRTYAYMTVYVRAYVRSLEYLFIYLLLVFYIPPTCANTSERSAGSRV